MTKDLRFTGGDNLTGLEAKVHEVLMQTELNNGKGAYKLTYAENKEGGNSGLSFGGNQMDLGSGEHKYKDLFEDILRNARDSSGNLVLQKDSSNQII